MPEDDFIGATPKELASRSGLLLDLALSLVPRRVSLARGLLAMLGGSADQKVATLIGDVNKWGEAVARIDTAWPIADRIDHCRELLNAVHRLENGIWSLLAARAKKSLRLIPTQNPEV